VLDVLLDRHAEVSDSNTQRSMLQFAEDLILQASEKIRLITNDGEKHTTELLKE